MSDGPFCAHLKISWRTKQVPYEGPVLKGTDMHVSIKPGMMVTQGWWDCDSCNAKFVPATAMEHETEKLKEGLRAFGKHAQWCWSRTDEGCSCGLTQLRGP